MVETESEKAFSIIGSECQSFGKSHEERRLRSEPNKLVHSQTRSQPEIFIAFICVPQTKQAHLRN